MKKSCSYWKKKAWKAFSAYIRRKDTNQDGYVDCYTCEKPFHWKQIQAGHFVDGRNNTVLYDPNLVKPQCYRCNMVLKGNKVAFTLRMLEKYSPEEIAEFESRKHKTKPMTAYEHQVVYELYKCWLV